MVTGWVGEASGLHEMDMARAGSFREIIALCLPFVADTGSQSIQQPRK